KADNKHKGLDALITTITATIQRIILIYSQHDHRDLRSFPTRRSSDLPADPDPLPGDGPDRDRARRDHVDLPVHGRPGDGGEGVRDRKSTRLNSSHLGISYAVFCLKKKKQPSWPIHNLLISTFNTSTTFLINVATTLPLLQHTLHTRYPIRHHSSSYKRLTILHLYY